VALLLGLVGMVTSGGYWTGVEGQQREHVESQQRGESDKSLRDIEVCLPIWPRSSILVVSIERQVLATATHGRNGRTDDHANGTSSLTLRTVTRYGLP
jgi:hypothetical protein